MDIVIHSVIARIHRLGLLDEPNYRFSREQIFRIAEELTAEQIARLDDLTDETITIYYRTRNDGEGAAYDVMRRLRIARNHFIQNTLASSELRECLWLTDRGLDDPALIAALDRTMPPDVRVVIAGLPQAVLRELLGMSLVVPPDALRMKYLGMQLALHLPSRLVSWLHVFHMTTRPD